MAGFWSLDEIDLAASQEEFEQLPEHVKQWHEKITNMLPVLEEFEQRLFADAQVDKLPQLRALNPLIKLSS